MINLLHVSSVGMKAAGTEQMIHLLCRHLGHSGVTNYLWSPYGGGPTLDAMRDEGVVADHTLTGDPAELATFVDRHRIQAALVHSGSLNPLYLRPLFVMLKELAGCAVVEVMHRPRASWGAQFGIARIVAVAPHVAALQPGDYADRTVTILNGVELEQFRPSPELRAMSRTKWNIPRDALVAGFLGRLTEEKGPQDILEAATAISSAVDRAYFVFGGDGPLRQSLEQRVASLGLDNLRFPGQIPAHERRAFYSALDVLLFPSRLNDALPLVLIEASAMELAVVAYKVPAVEDLFLGYEESHFLAPPQDIGEFARITVRLLTEEAERKRLGDLNFGNSRRYSIQDCAKSYASLLKEVIASRTTPAATRLTPSMYRSAGNIALLLGDKPRAHSYFSYAVSAEPALNMAIQEDVQQFAEYVRQYRKSLGLP
jgi:glycosyltransferase involved in cell wall biosynthesis